MDEKENVEFGQLGIHVFRDAVDCGDVLMTPTAKKIPLVDVKNRFSTDIYGSTPFRPQTQKDITTKKSTKTKRPVVTSRIPLCTVFSEKPKVEHTDDQHVTKNTSQTNVSLTKANDSMVEVPGSTGMTLSSAQGTMTDRVDTADIGSAMTPFRQNKTGKRLTAEEIRRQHPRVVANHLDSALVSNQRLEKELRMSSQENAKLRGTLKDLRTELDSTVKHLREEKEVKLLEDEIQLNSVTDKNRILEENNKELNTKCKEQETMIAELEHKLETFRSEEGISSVKEYEVMKHKYTSLQLELETSEAENLALHEDMKNMDDVLQSSNGSLLQLHELYQSLQCDLKKSEERVSLLYEELSSLELALDTALKEKEKACDMLLEKTKMVEDLKDNFVNTEEMMLRLTVLEEENALKIQESDLCLESLTEVEGMVATLLEMLQDKFGIQLFCSTAKTTSVPKSKSSIPDRCFRSDDDHRAVSFVDEILRTAEKRRNRSPAHSMEGNSTGLKPHDPCSRTTGKGGGGSSKKKQSNVEYDASTLSASCGTPSSGAKANKARKSLKFSLPAEAGQSDNSSLPTDVESEDSHLSGSVLLDGRNNSFSGFAHIKSIPTSQNLSEKCEREMDHAANTSQMCSRLNDSPVELSTETSIQEVMESIETMLHQIMKTANIVERASKLSIRDLKGEIDVQDEKLRVAANVEYNLKAELIESTKKLSENHLEIEQLNERIMGLTKTVLSLQDHSFEVKKLEDEKTDLNNHIRQLQGERTLLSDQLQEALVRLHEAGHNSQCTGACLKRNMILQEKNQKLMCRLLEEKDSAKMLRDKASKRIKIIEENWHKAEEEICRFDELVESIRGICIKKQSMNTHPAILQVIRLIDGTK